MAHIVHEPAPVGLGPLALHGLSVEGVNRSASGRSPFTGSRWKA